MARVHVLKINSKIHKKGYRFQYNRVPQTEGRWTIKELKAQQFICFSFSHSIDDTIKEEVITLWRDKYGVHNVAIDYAFSTKFSNRYNNVAIAVKIPDHLPILTTTV